MNSRPHFERVKRLFDLAFVSGAAPVCGPLVLLALVAVYAESGRPLLFSQARMGKDGRPFEILKVRTMVMGGKAPDGSLFDGWTYAADPRVTRVGRVLRRFRIDELPQFWNVLRGEMSIVGPRPEPWHVAVTLNAQIPEYSLRHSVRPGITGLCQVGPAYGQFGTVSQSRVKLNYDLEYVRKASLLLDLRILLRSVPVLLRGTGVA